MKDQTTPASTKRLSLEDAVARSGASVQMLRDCESLGLLDDTAGPDGYDAQAVRTLRFVRRAQDLGFERPEVVELHALWQDGRRASFDVKRVALARADELAQRIEELERSKRMLEQLANCCEGSDRSDCPILDELAELKGFAGCHGAAQARVTP